MPFKHLIWTPELVGAIGCAILRFKRFQKVRKEQEYLGISVADKTYIETQYFSRCYNVDILSRPDIWHLRTNVIFILICLFVFKSFSVSQSICTGRKGGKRNQLTKHWLSIFWQSVKNMWPWQCIIALTLLGGCLVIVTACLSNWVRPTRPGTVHKNNSLCPQIAWRVWGLRPGQDGIK